MKIRPVLLTIVLAGCAVEPTPPALDEIEQHFNDCNPLTCGGGGTGGAPATTRAAPSTAVRTPSAS